MRSTSSAELRKDGTYLACTFYKRTGKVIVHVREEGPTATDDIAYLMGQWVEAGWDIEIRKTP